MTHGFDVTSPLVCEGIIGDGCGGGRIFYIEDEMLFVYDPYSKEKRKMLQDIKNAQKITKKRCIITIECLEKTIEFDLSSFV